MTGEQSELDSLVQTLSAHTPKVHPKEPHDYNNMLEEAGEYVIFYTLKGVSKEEGLLKAIDMAVKAIKIAPFIPDGYDYLIDWVSAYTIENPKSDKIPTLHEMVINKGREAIREGYLQPEHISNFCAQTIFTPDYFYIQSDTRNNLSKRPSVQS